MTDYALMNQYLYEGKAKEVEQMTKDALADVETQGRAAGLPPEAPRLPVAPSD